MCVLHKKLHAMYEYLFEEKTGNNVSVRSVARTSVDSLDIFSFFKPETWNNRKDRDCPSEIQA